MSDLEMCGCVCNTRTGDMVEECVAHSKLREDLAAARARVENLEGAEEDRDEYQRQAKLYAERCAESDMELAAARALLKEAKRIGGIGTVSEWCLLCERIDAVLGGEKK